MTVSVLIVEDDQALRIAVEELLQGAGYEVHCAENPDEAMALLDRLPRPCILFWDALTPWQSLSMVDQATLEGVHVATLPVSLATVRGARSDGKVAKRLTSAEAILNIVREYCPLPVAASA